MVGVRGVAGGVAAARGRAARGAGGGFSLGAAQAEGAVPAQATTAAQPLGLLALQEAGPVGERDARARRRGDTLLRGLSDLQRGMLEGRLDPAGLRVLAACGLDEDAADPALAAALAAIRLRARVELARLGLDTAASPD